MFNLFKKKKCKFCDEKNKLIQSHEYAIEQLQEDKIGLKQKAKSNEFNIERLETLRKQNQALKDYILKNTPVIKGLKDTFFQNDLLLKVFDINLDDHVSSVDISMSAKGDQIPNVTVNKEIL